MLTALSKPLSESEVAILSYCSGYFFRKLLEFHTVKKVLQPCEVCSCHGEKFSQPRQSSILLTQSDLFLYFKRYNTDSATLFKCSEHFMHFIQTIIQVTHYCADLILDEDRIVNIICLSVNKHLHNLPQFCSSNKSDRFVSLVARTMLVYRIKWLNNELKSKKKYKRGKGKIKKPAKKSKSAKKNSEINPHVICTSTSELLPAK